MDTQHFKPEDDPMDGAIADRLGKLRSMPVDTSALERAIAGQIPAKPRATITRIWFRPMRAIAASVAVLAIIAGLLISTAGGPVLASASEMAQFHNDLVTGKAPVMRVDSIDAANQSISAQWDQSPRLPKTPDNHVMACCMRSVKNKKVVCVLLKGDDEPVSLTVANASDMKLPESPTRVHGGVTYHVQAVDDLNMVMTERNERWICLVSKLPVSRLMELASNLQF